MITEERIKELAEKWWGDRLLGIEDFIKIVAAEARKEGISEAGDVAIKLAYDVMGATLGLARSYSERLIEAIKQLKEEE